jgi:LPXTG-motif cell wall-anchored protein
MGTGPIETLTDEAPGWVLVSPTGDSWQLVPIEDSFHELFVADDLILGTTAGSVSTWSPVSGQLPVTGTDSVPVAVVGITLLCAGALLVGLQRRFSHRLSRAT